jgi:hypothetical protein
LGKSGYVYPGRLSGRSLDRETVTRLGRHGVKDCILDPSGKLILRESVVQLSIFLQNVLLDLVQIRSNALRRNLGVLLGGQDKGFPDRFPGLTQAGDLINRPTHNSTSY